MFLTITLQEGRNASIVLSYDTSQHKVVVDYDSIRRYCLVDNMIHDLIALLNWIQEDMHEVSISTGKVKNAETFEKIRSRQEKEKGTEIIDDGGKDSDFVR